MLHNNIHFGEAGRSDKLCLSQDLMRDQLSLSFLVAVVVVKFKGDCIRTDNETRLEAYPKIYGNRRRSIDQTFLL